MSRDLAIIAVGFWLFLVYKKQGRIEKSLARSEVTQRINLELVNLILKKLNPPLETPSPAVSLEMFIIIDGKKQRMEDVKEFSGKMEFDLELGATDKDGKAAGLDGKAEWKLDEKFGSLIVSEDGLKAKLKTSGEIGAFAVEAKGDGQPGSGVSLLMTAGAFVCLPPAAVFLGMKISDGVPILEEVPPLPEPIPEPAPEVPA